MTGEAPLTLSTTSGELRFRVLQVASAPAASERKLAETAGFILRTGLEQRDPPVLAVANELERELENRALASPRGPTSSRGEGLELDALAQRLTAELRRGRIRVELVRSDSLTERDPGPLPDLGPPPRPAREDPTTTFEVRFVDEIGQAISGAAVEFDAGDGPEELTTNPGGVALLEGVTAVAAIARVADSDALEELVDPRWKKARPGKPPKESNLTRVVLEGGEFPTVGLKAAVPNTVVVEPPRGKLFVELFDKRGRVRHAKLDYVIEGPERFTGTTDERGNLLHENVFPGDYELSFELKTVLEGETFVDAYKSPLVVLPATASAPEVRQLGAVPRLVQARLKGMFFDTNKSFLLPASVAIFDRLRDLYLENQPAILLVVGHTDTTAEPNINDPLSLERAENTAAFLKDDVDKWLDMYETRIPEGRRWGDDEDQAMIFATPDFETKPEAEDPIRWFQRTRGLEVDGIAGPETRRELIKSYMDLDGASLGGDEFAITLEVHGCGENFPVDDGGEELDPAPEDEQEDQQDRRVELFFFDTDFGIVPKPPGKNSGAGSTQYPAWRKRAELARELSLGPEDALILAWPETYTSELPDDLKLKLVPAGSPAIERDYSDGVVSGDVREFLFEEILSGTSLTLSAASGENELVLFRDQLIVTGVPPEWEHTLNEFMFEQFPDEPDFEQLQGDIDGDDSFDQEEELESLPG